MNPYRIEVTHDGRMTETSGRYATAQAAAEAASRSVYAGMNVHPDGDGKDLSGPYERFTARFSYGGPRTVAIRVRQVKSPLDGDYVREVAREDG